MSQSEEEGEEFDLGISLEIVATVVDLANAVQDAEEGLLSGEDDDEEDEDEDEISEEMLTDFIDELNEEQQVALIALAWIGRGDYEPEEWEEALKMAAERNARGDASTYLAGMEGLGDLLSEGVGAFGLAIEEVER
ncbi:DUF3775 domain-containing protein [Roseococcus sp. SDR]|uniref:DUF3775 domain-containing protein n=1 Tax=Roseococcus sp. SDR TaxID=2835532 RepID=UPI001BCE0FC4|nr:DUF3775 domain-containing protein [Roseococcus sp. SDR]MBS7791093.1 DUF3775 domain-containing protein [Roseococcus sp. SDR]MBV1846407.1 DUF3775 domain-containing protein [Roseococcus sp. SDR]